jgi:hypothetical protein
LAGLENKKKGHFARSNSSPRTLIIKTCVHHAYLVRYLHSFDFIVPQYNTRFFCPRLQTKIICAGDIAARIYQPGYSGYRGGRQEIFLVFEYDLSSVADVLTVGEYNRG